MKYLQQMRRTNSEGRSGGREDSGRDKKRPNSSREVKPATGFKKYRDADKSEAGWTKSDGKPMRKRVDKKDGKSFSNAKPPRREGGYTENRRAGDDRKPFREKKFDSDRREGRNDDRKPVREISYGDKRESGDRKPFREKSFGDKREGGERKPFRDKSFGGERSERSNDDRRPARENSFGGDRNERSSDERRTPRDRNFSEDRRGSNKEDRKKSGERNYRAEKKNNEGKPFGKFYKEEKSFSKNKSGRAEGSSRFTDNKFSDRKPSRFGSTESRPYEKKEFKRPGKNERSKTTESTTTQTEGIRLNRFIANSGICSRREADELIEAGVISVNGETVIELGTRVNADDDIRYNGERMKSEKLVYLILNKPKDYITTTDDPQERKTVMELVKSAGKERFYPVGRLDRNTTGLLMLTNDGEMTKKLTHPSSNIFKVYHVELDKPLKKEHMNAIAEGVELEDGFIKVDEIAYDDEGAGDKTMVGVEIHSGKNRIVRRIFEHFDYEVKKLDRVIFAGLTKKDLARGRWRYLSEDEINMLKVMTGSGKSKSPKFDSDKPKRKPRSKSETE